MIERSIIAVGRWFVFDVMILAMFSKSQCMLLKRENGANVFNSGELNEALFNTKQNNNFDTRFACE